MIDLYRGDISNGQENVPVSIEKDVSEDSLPDFQVYYCLFVLFVFKQNQSLFDFFLHLPMCLSLLCAAASPYGH